MLTDDDILEIQNMINESNSNEELLASLKSYFIQKTSNSELKDDPLYVAWAVYQNIIQNNQIV
tara:strand:+ start:649 stop:837 length:189 start_codon:yes stop_codon:yes gene_type:complete